MSWQRPAKSIWGVVVVLLLVAVVLAGCAQKEAGTGAPSSGKVDTTARKEAGSQGKAGMPQKAEFVLRFAQVNPEGDHAYAWTERFFCRRVEELTGGRVKVEYFPGGMLGGNERQYAEQLMTGVLDFAHLATAAISTIVPELDLMNVPMLLQNGEQYHYLWWHTRSGELLRKKLEEKNLVLIATRWCGERSVFAKRPVKSLEDLKGLKIRVMQSDTIIEAWKLLGAAPVPMAYGELYSALQTGTVDAGENMPMAYLMGKFYEVAPYYCLTKHQGCPCIVVASASTLNKLPPELREAVLQAGQEATAYMQGFTNRSWRTELQQIKELGKNIVEFDRTGVEDKLKPLYDKLSAQYPDIFHDMQLVRERYPLGFADVKLK